MERGGHLLRPLHARRAPMWVSVRCGCCGIEFVANAYSVPQFRDAPACRGCWRRLNLLRRQANVPEWDTPEDAYPGADPNQVRHEIAPVSLAALAAAQTAGTRRGALREQPVAPVVDLHRGRPKG